MLAGLSLGAHLGDRPLVMKPLRLSVLLAAALVVAGGEVRAQNFFERLFGIAPQPQPQRMPPAYNYPAPNAPPQSAPGYDGPNDDAPRRSSAPSTPTVARAVSIRAPSEDNIVGRDLKLNGSNGNLRFERAGRDMRARLTLVGRKGATSPETCSVPVGSGEPQTLVSQGRPDGTARYQLADPTCPLQIDVLDEAVLVKGPEGGICTFAASTCEVDPSGVWGPEPSQLMSRVRDYEQQRASSDKVVRENYKVLAQRARPEAVRPVVAEQAAFSAEREMACRSYAREGSTSFCNAKFSEARALSLAARLGVASTASTASADPPRRRRSDPYALPSTDELIQRRRDDD